MSRKHNIDNIKLLLRLLAVYMCYPGMHMVCCIPRTYANHLNLPSRITTGQGEKEKNHFIATQTLSYPSPPPSVFLTPYLFFPACIVCVSAGHVHLFSFTIS